MEKLKKYNPERRAYIAHELLDKYRFNLTIHGQKLLFGLAQSLEHSSEIFPTWEIDIREVFKYLNISDDNNERYEIVRKAFMEISENPIQWRVTEKKWGSIPWHRIMSYDEEKSNYIKFEFNELAKPFLLALKQFCQLETKYYIELPTTYSMWLYPQLKNHVKQGWHRISIERLKEITYNEKTESYDPKKNKDANRDFLRRVVGIQNDKKTKTWRCTKDKKGKETGAIAEINEHTDIEVSIKVEKDGKKFSNVYFTLKLKAEVKKTEAVRYAKRHAVEEIKTDKGFEMRIPMSLIKEYAIKSKMSVEEYLKLGRYKERNGYAVKNKKQDEEPNLFNIIQKQSEKMF
jgi:plasmid replication initiation protein